MQLEHRYRILNLHDGTDTRDKGTNSMSQSQVKIRASKYALGGALAVLVGAVMAVVFALQPWRECPEDDVAAGCAALPQDTAGMIVGLVILLGGLVLLFVSARRRRQA